jgi:hypothetical protein
MVPKSNRQDRDNHQRIGIDDFCHSKVIDRGNRAYVARLERSSVELRDGKFHARLLMWIGLDVLYRGGQKLLFIIVSGASESTSGEQNHEQRQNRLHIALH